MTINQLAEALNEKAVADDFSIGSLPELRKKYLHKKQLPGKIFTGTTIFDKEDKYAFHHGGRDEMQFNVGEEYVGDNAFTRYALCFSLRASRSLTNPVEDLEPFRRRFNECIEAHANFFKGFEMWYYQNNSRHPNVTPQKIPNEWFQDGTFIAIGGMIEKPLKELNEIDLTEILNGFDNLLPIYQFCVLQSPSILSTEKRIARVCWNETNWVCPSGEYGKSTNANSHERKYGYGHEEWLFDFDKAIDGYLYVLLQPIQSGRDTSLNKNFDVSLFSHNSDDNKNFWVGSIKNLEVISNEEAKDIYQHYKDRGWINEMAQQIKSVQGDSAHFLTLAPHHCFNARFKPEYARLDKPYKEVVDFNSAIGTYHYQFVRDKSTKQTATTAKLKKRTFKFKPGKSDKSLINRVSTRRKKIVQSEPIHDKIQEILYNHLVMGFEKKNVGMETATGLSTRIDVSVNAPDGIILYEVKSYPSVMISIRAAFGQLLEYAYYPNPIENLKEIIIVSHIPIGEEDKEYLEFLRGKTSLKLFYQSVDLDTRKVTEKC